jgi:hypothetical protein
MRENNRKTSSSVEVSFDEHVRTLPVACPWLPYERTWGIRRYLEQALTPPRRSQRHPEHLHLNFPV